MVDLFLYFSSIINIGDVINMYIDISRKYSLFAKKQLSQKIKFMNRRLNYKTWDVQN